jgi:sulfur-oxidizing protein SoxZ
MAEPMKIRALLKGDVVDIRVLIAHPMETGQRKDGARPFRGILYLQFA